MTASSSQDQINAIGAAQVEFSPSPPVNSNVNNYITDGS
jgi:hypothetical protein